MTNDSSDSTVGSDPLSSSEILNLLEGTIDPVRKPAVYSVGLGLVALGMILLPLIYLLLIALLGYGVFYHATHSHVIFAQSGNWRFKVLAYLGPLVIGVIALLFMIKPIFARPPKGPEPETLDAGEHPLIYHYVNRLSDLLGAPRPKRIDLDTQVNASASFRRGVFSMLGSDLVLTIGTPLIAGMSLRLLTGILAHELGHFAQRGGMGLSYVIRSINFWFARVVYERDAFDAWLQETIENTGHLVAKAVLFLALGFVWLSRRVLWVLMWIGNLISRFLLRQMEFDADRYQARVAGSRAFADTAHKLHLLAVAAHGAHQDLHGAWAERKLADDFSRLVMHNFSQIDTVTSGEIWDSALERKTGWLDTHPADCDRVANAEKENTEGLIQTDLPSTSLFSDYPVLSRRVTESYYAHMLGEQFKLSNLVDTSLLLEGQKLEQERIKAFNRYFQGHLELHAAVFVHTEELQGGADLEPALSRLKELRARIAEGLELSAEEWRDLLRERLLHSLRLLWNPDVTIKLKTESVVETIETAERLAAFQTRFESRFPTLLILKSELDKLHALCQDAPDNEHREEFLSALQDASSRVYGYFKKLRDELEDVPYPFHHAEGDVSCAVFAFERFPYSDDIADLANATIAVLNNLFPLYLRTLGCLAAIAERVEDALGLPRLDERPTETEREANSTSSHGH